MSVNFLEVIVVCYTYTFAHQKSSRGSFRVLKVHVGDYYLGCFRDTMLRR